MIHNPRPVPRPSADSPSPDLNKNFLRSIGSIQDIITDPKKNFLYTLVTFFGLDPTPPILCGVKRRIFKISTCENKNHKIRFVLTQELRLSFLLRI